MEVKKIAIGCDHAGFPYKNMLIKALENKGIEVKDSGTFSLDSVDYPDFVHPVASKVNNQTVDLGILLCGSGNGVAMTANKHANVRAALCWTVEIAALARQHNNANIICLPVRFITESAALEAVDTFVNTLFEGGRHGRRVGKISLSC